MSRRPHAQHRGPQFEALRRQVTLRLLALGALAIGASGVRLLVTGAGSLLYRASLAAVTAGLLGCAVLGLVFRREAPARLGAGVLLVAYLTVSFARTLLLPGEPALEEIGSTAVWLPVILAVVWLLSYPRGGVRAALLAYALATAPAAVFVGLVAAHGTLAAAAGRLAVLTQTVLAGLAMLVLVHSAEQIVAGYVRARAQAEAMRQLASTDALTGMPNRRYLSQELAREIALAERHERTLSVTLFDLDWFKAINDTYGHAAGDEVLARVARTIAARTRQGDLFGRWGGEEFLVIAPDTAGPEAGLLAERLRAHLAGQHLAPDGRPLTASFGVATYRPGDTPEELLARADQALYEAKAAGRNRVALAA